MMSILRNTRLVTFSGGQYLVWGVNVTSASGIPLSLDKDEYVLLEEAEKEQPIDNYSYQCGVMDCFCEMVASGLKSWQ